MAESPQSDMFGEEHIYIKDNEVLARACTRLLDMTKRHPELLKGTSVAEIDRKIFASILWEDGVQHLIPSDKKEEFFKVITKTQDGEVWGRARRYLLEHDHIRLASSVIKKAEIMRSKISGAMR